MFVGRESWGTMGPESHKAIVADAVRFSSRPTRGIIDDLHLRKGIE